jgi:Cu(I)/Ag(I) efflux system protein CusF
MKYRRVLAALLVTAAAAVSHAQTAVHKATGVVTKVDKDKVMIKHEPVRTLNWPGMTMAFTVKDKALMEKLAKDRKVDFEFRQEGRDYVVTSVK